jgi:hypothetical protein
MTDSIIPLSDLFITAVKNSEHSLISNIVLFSSVSVSSFFAISISVVVLRLK